MNEPPKKCPYCDKVLHWGKDNDSSIVPERMEDCNENAYWKLSFHIEAEHPDEGHSCPRRSESFAITGMPALDWWEPEGDNRTCSYCGSLHPEDFFKVVEDGVLITPTDKSYKVYVDVSVQGAGKFYFQHLTDTQMQQHFIDLLNEKRVRFKGERGFYVKPYFIA